MADLESVLADVSYLLAVDKSRGEPSSTKVAKRIVLPDASVHCVMHKYLTRRSETSFRRIFEQKIGSRFYLDFCAEVNFTPPLFYNEILEFEALKGTEERVEKAKKIYDKYIMTGLLVREHEYSENALETVRRRIQEQEIADCLFEPYKVEIEKIVYRGKNLFESFLTSRYYVRFCQWKNLECSFHPSMQDFVMHRIIGRGGFGEVYGCRKCDTGMMYAMKCLDKKRLKLKNGEKAAINERNVLAQVNNPFIVCMTYAFQTPEKLCFVLDLMNGGDLHYHLTQYKYFDENQVRFYAQEIILGLEHLHGQNIVYRDLKPANCLLTEEGHVKISDLGLACTVQEGEKPKDRVGTHGYMAPEVLRKDQHYGCTSDWFSFGCMLFKMLSGHNPFRHGRGREKVDIDRETLESEVTCPNSWSDSAKDLISRLLIKDPANRLGHLGATDVKEHCFFEDVDWRDVHALRYDPPFVPPRGEVNAMDSFQIGNFDDDDVKGIKLTEEDQKRWKDFNLVVSSRWQEEICATSVFDLVSGEYEKSEARRVGKIRRNSTDPTVLYDPTRTLRGDCVLEGYLTKRGNFASWERRYFRLYPNRLEWSEDQHLEATSLLTMEMVTAVTKVQLRAAKYGIKLVVKGGRHDCLLKADSEPEFSVWFADLKQTVDNVLCLLRSGPKLLRLGHPDNGQSHTMTSRYGRTVSDPSGASGVGCLPRGRTTDV